MNIHLSNYSPLNAVYIHESGQVLYKVSTPLVLGSRTSTIHKIQPNLSESVHVEKFSVAEADEDVEVTISDADLKDKFLEWATIQHKLLGSSVMRYDGQAIETSKFFRKEDHGLYGRHRVFTGPDGREYKWHLDWRTSRLYLNDEAKTPVAEFHPISLGVIGKKHPAYLQIYPAGLKIVDTILITFLYIEKKRKTRERGARSGGGGGGT